MRDRDRAVVSSVDAAGAGLRAYFHWEHDRYAHKIVVIGDGDEATLLESLEGTSEETWPSSPPLQQLSIEEIRPGVEVGLLVGMAGKSHWSVSIEPQIDQPGFIFDVACRSPEAAVWLGSSYQLASPAPTQLQLASLALDDAPSSCNIEERPLAAIIMPAAGVCGNGGTVRWKYRVGMST